MAGASESDDPGMLVSTAWLAAHLDDPDLRIIDATWFLGGGRDAHAEYLTTHVPGARFWDLDRIADPRSDLPHMAPPAEMFVSRVRAMGIGDGHQVVIYDNSPLHSAARVWWNFRLMGHDRVAMLDGGLGKWLAEGRPTDNAPAQIRDRHVNVRRRPALLRSVTQVAAASKLGDHEIVDARAPERFRGEVAEPRPGLRSGHIPGSKNLPFGRLYHADGTLKPARELRAEFESAGVDLSKPIITTCGSGVTAASLFLALARIGHHDHSLYDGSWAEWGSFPDLKIATGDA